MTGGGRLRILLIRLSAIGDVVVTTPVSRALREALPEASLTWVVEARARGVLEGNPYLDELVSWDRPKGTLPIGSLLALGRELRTRSFDWAVDFQGNLRSALVARFAGARQVVGNWPAREYAHLLYSHRVRRNPSDLSSRQRCLDLLQPLGVVTNDRRLCIAVSEEERREAGKILEDLAVEGEFAALVPATTWAQKHWVESYWAELARGLAAQGLTPVVMGSPADRELAARIASGAPGAVVAAGRTSLKSAAALLALARVTVAVDTALMHLSVAMGTPTVGLCGASWWKGFQDYDRFQMIREPLPCSPCLHHPTCGGRWDCMAALTPARVLGSALSLAGGALRVLP